jgi:hypothetical protein
VLQPKGLEAIRRSWQMMTALGEGVERRLAGKAAR